MIHPSNAWVILSGLSDGQKKALFDCAFGLI